MRARLQTLKLVHVFHRNLTLWTSEDIWNSRLKSFLCSDPLGEPEDGETTEQEEDETGDTQPPRACVMEDMSCQTGQC